MGGLWNKMPLTFVLYLTGALALAGIAPLAGFWSKDEILAHANENNGGVYVLLTLAAICTAFYMGRQLKMIFFGQPRHEAAEHASDSPAVMWVPLAVLAALAFFGGYYLNLPYFSQAAAEAAHGHPEGDFLRLESWLEHSLAAFELTEEGVVNLPHTPIVFSPTVAGISTVLAVGALAAAFFVVYARRPGTAHDPDPLEKTPIWWFAILPVNTLYMKGLVPAFNRTAAWLADTVDERWWHDFFHDRLLRDGFLGWTRFINDVVDTQGVDGALVNGSGRLARALADLLRRSQTGYVRNYALGVFLGVVALLAYFIFAG